MKNLGFLAFASMVTLTLALAHSDVASVGHAAPDFELPGSDGNTYSLEQFKGDKPVVLAWFPKAFTGG